MDEHSIRVLCMGLSLAFAFIGWGIMKLLVAKAADITRNKQINQTEGLL